MTIETRSPHEIERDIERDRAELTNNLETLQDRFSMDGVMRSVGDQLRDHSGEIGASISRTVKENPAAVALTGIGLAWMIFGNKSERSHRPVSDYRAVRGSHSRHDDREPRAAVSRSGPRFKGENAGFPSWAIADDDDNDDFADRVSDAAASARDGLYGAVATSRDGVTDAAASVQDGAARAGSAVSSKLSGASAAVSDATTGAARSAGEIARTAQERAKRMKDRLAEGTESFSEEAKARVVAAREAALDARRRATGAASAGAEQASDFYDSQPLVAGAIAVAVGAALGGALPRTRKEDELMGAKSDELMRQAERIFLEEKEKAKAVIGAAKHEAETIAKEKCDDHNHGAPGEKSTVEAIADETRRASKRVADAAAAKAEEKDLGKINS